MSFVRLAFTKIAFIACILAMHVPALADDTHYQTPTIGEAAIGMGGAFTGVADDASAAFYNPAGLVHAEKDAVAGGLSLFAFERFEIDKALRDPRGAEDFKLTSRTILPVFVAAVKQFGPRARWRKRRFALAYSTVQPITTERSSFLVLKTDANADTFEIDERDRATYYGLSFAWRINRRWAFGFTNYLSVRKRSHRESSIVSTDPGAGTEDLAARSSSLSIRAFHLLWRFGLIYQMNSKWRFGWMLQAPAIPLRQRARLKSQTAFADQSGDETTLNFFEGSKLSARLPVPLALRAGFAFQPRRKILLAADLGLHAPIRSRSVVSIPASADLERGAGVYFPASTKRSAVINLSLGAQFKIKRAGVIRTGVFSDTSAAPSIPATATSYRPARLQRLGVSSAFGFKIKRYGMALGITGIWGRGDALAAVVDLGGETFSYVRTNARSRAIILNVTGAADVAVEAFNKAADSLQRVTK